MTVTCFTRLPYILGASYGSNRSIIYQKMRAVLVTQGCHSLCGGPHFLMQI